MDFNSWNDNTTALQNAYGYGGAVAVATAVVVAVPDNRARIEVGHIATAIATPVVGLPADLLEDIKTIPFRPRWVGAYGDRSLGWLRELPNALDLTSDQASLAFYGPLLPCLDRADFINYIRDTLPPAGSYLQQLDTEHDLLVLRGLRLYDIKYVNNIVRDFKHLQKRCLRTLTMERLPESQHEYKWNLPNYHLLQILKDNGIKGRAKLANNKYSSLTNTRVPAIRALMAV